MEFKRQKPVQAALKSSFRNAQRSIYRLYGAPTKSITTELTLNDAPVLFLHNPKAAGTSLRKLLGVAKHSHVWPREKLSARYWEQCFSIAAVRHPFDRFVSGYFYHVLGPYTGGLVKQYGAVVKTLDPYQYLDLLQKEVAYLGSQTNWTDFPSDTKPRVDLLLRVEQSDQWIEQFTKAGLNMSGREMPHANQSEHKHDTRRERMKMTQTEFEQLRGEIFNVYKNDYETFGYDK